MNEVCNDMTAVSTVLRYVGIAWIVQLLFGSHLSPQYTKTLNYI